MNAPTDIMPDAEPFSAEGDCRGVLVSHGFTRYAQSILPLSNAFAAAGFTIEVARLPNIRSAALGADR